MVKYCKVMELPTKAFHYGSASASGGRWRAERVDDWTVYVWHFDTLMVGFTFDADGYWSARPINAGWGSQTDRRGVGDMLRFQRCQVRSYRELYGE